MIIKELINPLTEEYLNLREHILGENFPWYCSSTSSTSKGIMFFSHCLLRRPDTEFPSPRISSNQYYEHVVPVLRDIFNHNNILVNSIMRININCTLNVGGGMACPLHCDHEFKHKNLLIYLNDSTGPTVVINGETEKEEHFYPKQDIIIKFEGRHYHYQPNIGERRIVLVATYI
jgi:hypothetical protein